MKYLAFQIRLKKNTTTNIRYRSATTVDKDVTKARYQSDIPIPHQQESYNRSCLPTFCTIKNIYRRCTINLARSD